MSCDEFEIAIEKREQGALVDGAALDAHLLSCASCTRFAALVRDIDDSLARHQEQEMGRVNMDSIRAQIQSGLSRRRTALALSLLFLAGAATFFGWWQDAIEARRFHWSGQLFYVVCVGIFLVARSRRWAAEAERTARAKGELLTWWRNHIDRNLRDCRFLIWLTPPGAIALLPLVWWLHVPGTERIFFLGAAAWLALGFGLTIWAVRSRAKLLIERASLE